MSLKFRSFILSSFLCLIFVAHSNPVLSQSPYTQEADTSILLSSNQNGNPDRDISTNFYKADSVFSFRSDKGYFPSLIDDFAEQAKAPFKMNTKQLLMTGAGIGITAVLIHFDPKIDDWARVQKQKHYWISRTSPVITRFGGDWGVYSVIASGVISAAARNEKGVQTSLLATQAMITSGLWVNIIKIFTGRERPIATYTFSKVQGGMWYGPLAKYDQDAVKKPVSAYDAFPSGHTATAFAIATVFAEQYKDIKAIPIICYSAASMIGVSRLIEHQHWASDVFVGGIAGYLCGKQVVAHFNKMNERSDNFYTSKSKVKPELALTQYGNQIGLAIKW
jgi:membrane-associated phospholipid phosphatase